MSDKKPKLWESTFGDSDDDSDLIDKNQASEQSATDDAPKEYSRTHRHETQQSNKVLVWSLVVVLLAIMCLPVAWSAMSSGHHKTAVDSNNQVAVSSKPKSTKVKKQKPKKVASQLKPASSKKASEPSTVKRDDEHAADQNDKSEQSTANDTNNGNTSAQSSSETSNAGSATNNSSYYVVQAHDNAYRIALNHGMTTQQLYQLNGLNSNTVLRPGMQLRVR
ncbi:LysM peptidoglycan-binding domain-containing protein [Bombilactobacillus folatiphilus]|uniref:LysM peptidoglycan-binding domain-containing protein n=1 Tax=Bombilactobacillus folatiphilus TaxID=2923362 RepID=A0ABY4PAK1_9LACO|nr:LysM domain-containing protein [Bombilactobacillus folatiphilus]UQS82773.1 LysM peptidoglycan-binding domain-containing protein [Bombilactobacillus folatiphilus]